MIDIIVNIIVRPLPSSYDKFIAKLYIDTVYQFEFVQSLIKCKYSACICITISIHLISNTIHCQQFEHISFKLLVLNQSNNY